MPYIPPFNSLLRALVIVPYVLLGLVGAVSCGKEKRDGVTLFKEGRYQEAHYALKREAQMGIADAQNLLAISLQLGLAGERDPTRAVSLFQSAALRGHVGAQLNLGLAYLNGHGTAQDRPAAFGWFQRAADSGNRRAHAYLAVLTDKLTPNQMVRAREAIAKLVAQSTWHGGR